MTPQNEFQKFIPGFDQRYLINKNSTILDLQKMRIVHPHLSGVTRRNYPQVSLYCKIEGKTMKHTKRVHSFMAITFFGHEYGNRKIVVDHIDNDPLNNRLNNLQIISMKENSTKDK
jgi:hypothetical protein